MPWRQSLALQQQQRCSQQLWRSRRQLSSAQSVEVVREGKTYLNFCSNDYLGLANHPEIAAASIAAVKKWGTGTGASHLVCGHQDSHQNLEIELAEFLGAEKALLFSTGYMANLAIPQCFLRRRDLLLQDKLNHASLLDSAKLCQADFKRYGHGNTEQLERLLCASSAERKLISSDSVFSMDGDMAPILDLNRLAEQQSAVLLIDDAHGFGVLGTEGRGSYSEFDLTPSKHRLMLGTLGKALGSFGAFVAGDAVYIDQLEQQARTYTYTTALPASVAEASRVALRIVQAEPHRRTQLKESVRYLRAGIKQLNLALMPSDTAIQPIVFGDEVATLQASQILDDEGIWVSAIRPPTVAKGSSRLRITLSADHRREHLDRLLDALSRIELPK